MLPDPEPVDETPTIDAPAPATAAPGGRVWWAIVGVVALLAVIAGATALARQPPGPASVQKLAELLVDPAGRTTRMSMSIDPETGKRRVFFGNGAGPGEIWTVTRAWDSPGTNRGVRTKRASWRSPSPRSMRNGPSLVRRAAHRRTSKGRASR